MDIGVYEAKTHFARLVARVQKGERITITKHGKPVAELVPPAGTRDMARHREVVDRLLAIKEQLRSEGVHISWREVKEWINEGRP